MADSNLAPTQRHNPVKNVAVSRSIQQSNQLKEHIERAQQPIHSLKCCEKGCPFPASQGDQFCRYHRTTLEMTVETSPDDLRRSSLHAVFRGELRIIYRQDSHEIRDARKRRGLCPNCGQRPPVDGYSCCSHCRQVQKYWNNRYKRERAERRALRKRAPRNSRGYYISSYLSARSRAARLKAANSCRSCAKTKSNNTLLCNSCRQKKNESMRKLHRRRALAGVCRTCGQLSRPRRTTCERCGRLASSSVMKLYQTRKTTILCVACGQPKQCRQVKCDSCRRQGENIHR